MAARKGTMFTCLQVAMLVGCTIIFCQKNGVCNFLRKILVTIFVGFKSLLLQITRFTLIMLYNSCFYPVSPHEFLFCLKCSVIVPNSLLVIEVNICNHADKNLKLYLVLTKIFV